MAKNNDWAPAWNDRISDHQPFFSEEGNMKTSLFSKKSEEDKLLWELDHFNKLHATMKTKDGKKIELIEKEDEYLHMNEFRNVVVKKGNKRMEL
jgi:hypothetical protein